MQILAEEPDMKVVSEANNAGELLKELERQDCDVLVLDISMPGRSGLDVLGEIKKRHSNIPVLILSMHPEDQFGIRVLRAGAAGYMTKESVPAELVSAIRRVSTGKRYVSPTLADRIASELESGGAEKPLHENLSDREFQVLQAIASGKMIKEIASEFSLSIKTISTYRKRILDKMNMTNNAELIMFAMDNDLIGVAGPSKKPREKS
jgi:DNA-binding NarL/FixJ family response regulator